MKRYISVDKRISQSGERFIYTIRQDVDLYTYYKIIYDYLYFNEFYELGATINEI